MSRSLIVVSAATLLFVGGCFLGGLSPDGGAGRDFADQGPDARRCGPGVVVVPGEGASHVPFGTAVMYQHNPPASGNHWAEKADWGAYAQLVPREQWVHNLEHGGIVLLYNCPGGPRADAGISDGGAAWPCPEITTPLRALRDERKNDKWGVVRVLVSADPLAPRRVSAVAWGWVYQADSVDEKALRCFIEARYGRGPEDAP